MKRFIAFFMMTVLLAATLVPGRNVCADSIEEKPYLSLGADLSEAEKKTVFELLGVDADNLDGYTVGKVTNAEEHEYLSEYVPSNVIGTRALSSVLVTLKEGGHGIDVSTMKAYEAMTGEVITEETKDAATNELVTTGELAKALGDAQSAEELIALIKEKVLSGGLTSLPDIKKAIEEACKDLNINLSEEDRQMILDLMNKIKNLDIDVEQLKEQANAVYEKLAEMGIDLKSESFWLSVKDAFNRFFDFVLGLFFREE